MNVTRRLEVANHNPVGAVREFLAAWWREAELDALLAPVELADGKSIKTQVIDDPAGLAAVNPFAPVMLSNSATLVSKFSRDYPEGRLAAMLRPCELRALVELRKRRHAPAANDKVLILGVDCLSTLPPAAYAERVQAQGLKALTREGLACAADGDCSPHRPRTACRVCRWPAPVGADVTLGAIGVMPDEYLLLVARDEAIDEQLRLGAVTDGIASEAEAVRREIAVGAIAGKRSKVQAEASKSVPQRFNDAGSMLAWFAGCSLCGDCLDACPLYDGELGGLLGVGGTRFGGQALFAELVDVSRWLASCSGCGMCEEACGSDVPLTLFISAVTHRIQEELHYAAGDPSQRLPWAPG
jgi:formate dehydrogenase subunit beta